MELPNQKTVILDITPQSHVRSTANDGIFFRIPEWKLKPAGLARKKRLERYNNYKRELWALAHNAGIIKPIEATGVLNIICHVPASKSVRVPGMKRKDLEGTPMRQRPDWDNCGKAFCDAIWTEDSFIWDGRVREVWTLKEKGWIEVFLDG